MGKRERHFEQIERLKEKYRSLSTTNIRYRLAEFGTALFPEARIALRQLLQEREQGGDSGSTARVRMMTPDDWNVCSDPQAMVTFLHEQGRLSDRKARLFCVAVCRRIWPLLTDERSRKAVEVAERQADSLAEDEELAAVQRDTRRARQAAFRNADRAGEFAAEAVHQANDVGGRFWALRQAAGAAAVSLAWSTADDPEGEHWRAAWMRERAAQAGLLRDLVEPVSTAPFNPAWRTPAVLALAQAAYEDRRFDRLPILADSLEDAGCTAAELLRHLRSESGHVKGCWALDLVLGKE